MDGRPDVEAGGAWDGGEIEDWPGWRRLTEADPHCIIDVPNGPPKDAVPPIAWIPCANGNPKCQQVDTTGWSDGTAVFRWAKVSSSATQLLTLRMIKYVTNPNESEWAVYDLPSLQPSMALRHRFALNALCGDYVSVASTKSAVLIYNIDAGRRTLFHGAPSLLAANPLFVEVTPSLKGLGGTEVLAASDTTVAFDLQPLGSIIHNKPQSATFGRSQGLDLSLPFVVHDDVYASSEYGFGDGWENYYRIDADGSAVPYRAVPSKHVRAMASDGVRMYWGEAYGGINPTAPPTTVEIWSAPYTRDPSQLSATGQKLLTLAPGAARPANAIASKGYYAFQAFPNQVTVVEGATGKSQQITVAADSNCWGLTHVSATELWCLETGPKKPNGTALLRLQLDPW